LENNTSPDDKARKVKLPRSLTEPGTLHNNYTVTRETLSNLHKGDRQTTDKKGECPSDRESDSLIVPMKPGNAGRGKECYMLSFLLKKH
jgi:hypothetical protein